MTADDFRRLALELDGVVERSHMNHPDFRAHGRIFATLHTNDTFGMVAVTPEEQRELMRASSKVFVPSAGAWGRQGCTNVRLALADPGTVRAALLLAWEAAAAKKGTGQRAKKGTGQRAKGRGKG